MSKEAQFDFGGRTAIVTGSSQGIGRAIAEELCRCGATVVVSDIREDEGRAVAGRLGERAAFIPCDISSNEMVGNLTLSVSAALISWLTMQV